ncbi:hypothetical protein ACQCN2_07345 [Brevibacillus ginsengisoli]|uniref:hypothetical protein n=1 Tax=Brevibacillus ginsengisoli TaxID=363854 RepID=UPI003CECB517
MLEKMVQILEKYLQQEGQVADILLKSEQSVYDAGDAHEIELKFVSNEHSDDPIAHIHLYPIDEETCEVEVEVIYRSTEDQPRSVSTWWEQMAQIVEGATVTEKKRFASPTEILETEWIVNYFFLISLDEQEEAVSQKLLAKCAQEVGKLVRL